MGTELVKFNLLHLWLLRIILQDKLWLCFISCSKVGTIFITLESRVSLVLRASNELDSQVVFKAELVRFRHASMRLVQTKRCNVFVLLRMLDHLFVSNWWLHQVALTTSVSIVIVKGLDRLESLLILDLAQTDPILGLYSYLLWLFNHVSGKSKSATWRQSDSSFFWNELVSRVECKFTYLADTSLKLTAIGCVCS